MDNEKITNDSTDQDEDLMLPEGYQDENIFDEPAGTDEDIFGVEDKLEGFGGDGEGEDNPAPEDQPAEQKPKEENGVTADGGENSAPATAQQQENDGFRFVSNGAEVTVKETELPEMYRKAQEHGTLAAQLAEANEMAKSMGFSDIRAMMEQVAANYRNGEVKRLVDEGMHEEAAKDLVDRKMQAAKNQPVQKTQQPTLRRDFKQELYELVQTRPELRESLANGGKLPQEVVTACVKSNISLRAAYAEYEAREARANAERVRQENEILKQNELNAAKAPVKSVTAGGGTNTKGKDPFLQGFESDN